MIVNINWIKENYFKYNKIAFDGKLPTNIKFSASKALKRSCGQASCIMHFDTGTISDIRLSIASSFDNDEDSHLCTLLHEMIHIEDYTFHPEHYLMEKPNGNGYVIVKNYDAHGVWFLRECKRINDMNLIKFKISQFQEYEERKNEVDVREYKTRVCLLNTKTNDPSKVWAFLKTNENGMKSQISLVESNMYYFKKDLVKIEWYKQSDDKVGSLSPLPTKTKFKDYAYKMSDSERDKFIEKHGLILLKTIELDPDFKREKISDEKYIDNLDFGLRWSVERIVKSPDFKKNGIGVYNTVDSVSNIKLQISVDKRRNDIEILFNGGTPLNFELKEYLKAIKAPMYIFVNTYGEAMLNHLRKNKLIQENNMKNYKPIIREVIEKYLFNDSLAETGIVSESIKGV